MEHIKELLQVFWHETSPVNINRWANEDNLANCNKEVTQLSIAQMKELVLSKKLSALVNGLRHALDCSISSLESWRRLEKFQYRFLRLFFLKRVPGSRYLLFSFCIWMHAPKVRILWDNSTKIVSSASFQFILYILLYLF